jgi:hypothetical protein
MLFFQCLSRTDSLPFQISVNLSSLPGVSNGNAAQCFEEEKKGEREDNAYTYTYTNTHTNGLQVSNSTFDLNERVREHSSWF